MIDLALSIFSSSLIFVIFKLFKIYKVQTLYAIIVNYMTAFLVGIFAFQGPLSFGAIPEKPWFPITLILGVVFILVFNLMARTSQELGVSVASVATKMSFAIPVLFGVILYNEHLGLIKIIGILMALAAVYFASIRTGQPSIKRKVLFLPIAVFLGSGIIDVSIKFSEAKLVPKSEFSIFTAFLFGAAALFGVLFIIIRLPKVGLKYNPRNILGGLLLGVPNFFSIFFLLRALQNDTLNSASIFTINNVAIVMFSTLLGILLFKERISTKNWIGIAMAAISIVLVALGNSIFAITEV